MNIYHIQEDGDVSHWVAADNIVVALKFLLNATDIQDECESLSIDLMPQDKAEKMIIDDDGVKRSLKEFAADCKKPAYLAGSEY